MKILRLVLLFFIMILISFTVHAQKFELLDDENLGLVYELSGDGRIIVGDAGYTLRGAWRWENGEITFLGKWEGKNWTPRGISTNGNIIMGTALLAGPSPLIWNDGTYSKLPTTEEMLSWVGTGLSGDGSTAIANFIGEGGSINDYGAMKWVNGELTILNPLSGNTIAGTTDISGNGSVIVGQSWSPNSERQIARWVNSTVPEQILINGWSEGGAEHVSSDGSTITGQVWRDASGNNIERMTFRWKDGIVSQLGSWIDRPTGQQDTYPAYFVHDISGDGSILVGSRQDAPSIFTTVMWDESRGWRSLNEVFSGYGLDLQGIIFNASTVYISDDGTVIAGNGFRNGKRIAFRADLKPTVEEPLVVNVTGEQPNDPKSTAENICDVDRQKDELQCTLRAAIQVANSRAAADSISFDIPGAGPHTINIPTNLDQVGKPLIIDATTQPGFKGTPLITLQGAGSNYGIAISAGRSVIRGFAIGGFAVGIVLGGQGGNRIEGNYIGIAADGQTAIPNGVGITVQDTPNHRIGGDSAAKRNVISGNSTRGIWAFGKNSGGTIISGNYIGTNVEGTSAVENKAEGIFIEGAPNIVVGGITDVSRNLISGNAAQGIRISGEGATENRVIGNWFGLSADGSTVLSNGGNVIEVSGPAFKTQIGEAGNGNVVVGEETLGIVLVDAGESTGAPDETKIFSNTIGLTPNGTNQMGSISAGIWVQPSDATRGVANVQIGGEESGQGNRIAGAVNVYVSGPRSSGSSISGNTIGLKANGEIARPDEPGFGILLANANGVRVSQNTVGGQLYGIVVGGDENKVLQNKVGIDLSGEEPRPNSIGIVIPHTLVTPSGTFDVGDQNIIGSEGQGNIASGNTLSGIVVGVGVDLSGSSKAKEHAEITSYTIRKWIQLASVKVVDGKLRLGSISTKNNVQKGEGTADENLIAFNFVGTNEAGTKGIGNGLGFELEETLGSVYIGSGSGNRVLGNLISGNGAGLQLRGESPAMIENTSVIGNVIGGAAQGEELIPNQYGGMLVTEAKNTHIIAGSIKEGGSALGNRIIGNGEWGINVRDSENTIIRKNDFQKNTGPALTHFFLFNIPDAPSMFKAVANTNSVDLEFIPKANGSIDIFYSDDCRDGNADGRYILSGEATEEISQSVPLVYSKLSAGGPGDAIGKYLAVTTSTSGAEAETSLFSDCIRIAAPGDVAEVTIGEGETGPVVGDVGIEVDVTENDPGKAFRNQFAKSTGGTLLVARYHLGPSYEEIEGRVMAPDGSAVEPNAISNERYWTLRTNTIEGITYSACLDISSLQGVTTPEQLLVAHRPNGKEIWTPYPSTLKGASLCASGFTALGDLAVAADSLVNPIPVDQKPESPNLPGKIPEKYALFPPYPNPFNSTTNLRFDLPESRQVFIDAYDMLGRKVALLQHGNMNAGTHLIRFDATGLASGVYIIRVFVEGVGQATRNVTLMK